MKIMSDTGKAELEIVQNDDTDQCAGYWIALKIRTTDGEFSGANGCIHFSDFGTFVSRFSELLRTKTGDAVLDMTEGCRLEFFRWNQRGDVGLKAVISQSSVGYDPVRTTPVSVTGSFKLDSEFLNSIEHEFRKIKQGEPNVK